MVISKRKHLTPCYVQAESVFIGDFSPQTYQSQMLAFVLLVAVSACTAIGHQEFKHYVAKRSAMHFCGASLADALDLVCQYNVGKRSNIGEFP